MLAYLERLCAALIARDESLISYLRTNELAASLPRAVHSEMDEFCRLGAAARCAPVNTLHFYYEELQHARSAITAAVQVSVPARRGAARSIPSQIELPLSAA